LIELENIFPINNPNKKEYLIDITHKISKFAIDYYKDTFDPTILYSTNKITVDFNPRKNACVGICMRIQRVILYNEIKINDLEYSELIELAAHECTHLVYDGHERNFSDAFNFIMDVCVKRLGEYNRCLN
jgi:hypothetical protein